MSQITKVSSKTHLRGDLGNVPAIDPEKETKEITAFIRKAFRQAGKTKALIALSGGVDSATAFLLSVQALGPKNIYALHLPAKANSPKHLVSVNKLTRKADLPTDNFTVISLKGVIQKTWQAIKRQSLFHQQLVNQQYQPGLVRKKRQQISQLNRLRLANLAARLRMLIIYDQAKLLDGLVVGTENYSEHFLGYYTRFGDEASDLEPIRHLYKTQLYQLAKYLKVPKEIINRPPSAGLWAGQTDQKELGFAYRQADPILHLLNQGQTPSEIIKTGQPEKLVKKITARLKKNQFKQKVPYML